VEGDLRFHAALASNRISLLAKNLEDGLSHLGADFLKILSFERGREYGTYDLLPYLGWGGLGYIPPSGGLALGRVSGHYPYPSRGSGLLALSEYYSALFKRYVTVRSAWMPCSATCI